jgi:hypothetical protein
MTRSRHGRVIASATGAAIALAIAAPAGAATLSTSPCVASMAPSNARTLPISGSGFTPGARVTVEYSTPVTPGRTFLTAVTADANGAFSTRATPPLFHVFSTREQVFDLTATTDTDPPVEASTRYRQVLFGYEMMPRASSSTRVVRHIVRGFPAGRSTFLHFRLAGHTQGTVLLGRTSSPCGTVSRRMRALPLKVKTGRWTIYADQRRAFSLLTRPQARLSIVVRGR